MTSSVYLAQRLRVEPTTAQRLFNTLRPGKAGADETRVGKWFHSRLWLAAEAEPPSLDPLQLSKRRGILWIGPWPIKVLLECTIWSETESELGLRPRHLRWPVGGTSYFHAATAVLHEVAQCLMTGDRATETPVHFPSFQLPARAVA
jgi:hypothetical protein